jgi:predicted nucleic acid-binding protein
VELADTSAWTNKDRDVAVCSDFDHRVLAGEIALSPSVLMELLWSARNSADFDDIVMELAALPRLNADGPVWDRAVEVWRELVRRGRHRQVPQNDLVVAATAELARVPVCHYDRHFEVIAEVTGQPVRAIAPLGSLTRA